MGDGGGRSSTRYRVSNDKPINIQVKRDGAGLYGKYGSACFLRVSASIFLLTRAPGQYTPEQKQQRETGPSGPQEGPRMHTACILSQLRSQVSQVLEGHILWGGPGKGVAGLPLRGGPSHLPPHNSPPCQESQALVPLNQGDVDTSVEMRN